MTEGKILYKKGFKYQTEDDYLCRTDITGYDAKTDYIYLTRDGRLFIYKGYASDGPSGPTFDTKNSIRGAIEHDAKYQLMRLGLISETCRNTADKELRKTLTTDGMSRFRAWYWYEGVDHFAGYAARWGTEQKTESAPN